MFLACEADDLDGQHRVLTIFDCFEMSSQNPALNGSKFERCSLVDQQIPKHKRTLLQLHVVLEITFSLLDSSLPFGLLLRWLRAQSSV